MYNGDDFPFTNLFDPGEEHHSVQVAPELTPTPKDLLSLGWLHSPIMHFKCPLAKLRVYLNQIQVLHESEVIHTKPLVIFEPDSRDCNKAHVEEHLSLCKQVEVYSVNHVDLKCLFEVDEFDTFDADKDFDKAKCEQYAHTVYEAMTDGRPKRNAAVIIGARANGALVVATGTGTMRVHQWFPDYYGKDDDKFVDATGAGSTLLGAFAVTLLRTKDYRKAMMHGMVAASFAVEQIGLPTVKQLSDGSSNDTEEWNGETFRNRVINYGIRLA